MAENQIEEIKALLNKTGKVYVNELSDRFKVSKVSVRKYLAKLENQGLLVSPLIFTELIF